MELVTDLPPSPASPSNSNSKATGIDNAGLIVGSDGVTGEGFVYSAGAASATEVPPIAGSTLTFSGVNNNGIAVGTSSTANGGNTLITYNVSSAQTTDVGTGFTGSASSSYSSYGSAINDNNTVLGIGLQSSPTNSNPAHFQPFIAAKTAGGYTYTNVGNAVEAAIPPGNGTYTIPGYLPAQGLSLNGDVAGTIYGTTVGTYKPQFDSDVGGYAYNGNTGAVTNLGYTEQANAVTDVNGVAETVGTYYAHINYGGNTGTKAQFDAFTYTASGGFVDIFNAIQNYQLSSVVAINSNGDLLATGYLNGDTTDTLRYLLLTQNVIPSVTYTGTVSNAWNTTTANFTPANYANGDYVTFDDTATGSTTVNISSSVTPGAVIFNNSSKSYVINGSSISGTTTVTAKGAGSVTFNNVNTYTGATNISSGSVIVGSTGSLATNNINLSKNATMTVQSGGALTSTALNLSLSPGSSFTIAPTTPDKVVLQLASVSVGDYSSQVDVANTDFIVHNANDNSDGTSGASGVSYEIGLGFANGTWQGNGIVSSAARNDTTHLTTLGSIENSEDQTSAGTALYKTFDGVQVVDNDALVKYTYYGDANLDGKVDGSDYSLIDYAYAANQSGDSFPLTGWYYGDFNYDGVIDGSDYTLIDNAFNSQGAAFSGSVPDAIISDLIAEPSGTTAVPEPATLGLVSMVVLCILKRRLR